MRGETRGRTLAPRRVGRHGPHGASRRDRAQGPPGPGAIKLSYDHGTDDQLVTLATVGPWTLKERCSVSAVIRKAGTMVLSADAQPIVSVAFSLLDDSAGRCALSGTATPAA